MAKSTMLYASPFPPKKSGISDYSVQLVKALSEYFEITLYTDNYFIEEESLKDFPALRHGYDEIDFDSFEYKVYNIGNQPGFHWYIYEAAIKHPGMIILHDFVLYYLFVGYYQRRSELYSNLYTKTDIDSFLEVKRAVKKHGSNLLEQSNLAQILTLNNELISSGNKIMVHSDYSREKVLATGLISEEKVRKINHLALIDESVVSIDKDTLFTKYNVPQDAFIVTSFGYIAETKLNREVCETIKDIAFEAENPPKICYVMVGDGDYTDDELKDGLVIKTGYTDINEFDSFIKYSDLVVNLRYPSMGETSGAMIRILQMGKTCITNEGGWFSEIPDECVVKIKLDDLKKNLKDTIRELMSDEEKRSTIGQLASDYVKKEYAPDVIAGKIKEFLEN